MLTRVSIDRTVELSAFPYRRKTVQEDLPQKGPKRKQATRCLEREEEAAATSRETG